LTKVQLLDASIDGKSLAPLLLEKTDEGPHGILHWQVGNGGRAQWAVRDGDWKLIGNVRDTSNPKSAGAPASKLFLSNLKADPGELTNHAKEHPEIVKRLKAAHDSFR